MVNILKKILTIFLKIINDNVYYFKNKNNIKLSKKDFDKLNRFDKNSRLNGKTVFNNHEIVYTSPFWLLHSIDEIFVQQVYKFTCKNKEPFIIDCGANIGLSVIYFKELFPEAHILAFEADPKICNSLEQNLSSYNFFNVEIISAAVWNKEANGSFLGEGSVGGMLVPNNTSADNQIAVKTIRLKYYLERHVDFLKIDIEGAEYEVLKDCQDLLKNVENLFIEYHILPQGDQKLHEILTWVNRNGFKYYIKEAWNNMSNPFLQTYNDYFQMQLNVFCYKEKKDKTAY